MLLNLLSQSAVIVY